MTNTQSELHSSLIQTRSNGKQKKTIGLLNCMLTVNPRHDEQPQEHHSVSFMSASTASSSIAAFKL